MSTGCFEYKVDGINDEWEPARPTGRWLSVLDETFDLVTVSEVAFTIGDPDVSTVVIRYREVQA